ncbi:MAG: hypothetical protein JW818_16480 [Pirellulales bacterium]|nr:hypothetical protein [Pirellulales bacterium]
MFLRFVLAVSVVLAIANVGLTDQPASPNGWRGVGQTSPAAPNEGVRVASLPIDTAQAAAATTPDTVSPVRYEAADGRELTLSGQEGQIWREYDLSRYTLRVTTTKRPEQAVVDWVLRETGYEAWHGQPLSILSASPRKLRVYHTPQMQAVVASIVERFVGAEADRRAFGLRVMTVNSPTWRAKTGALLRPVATQTPGVQAWVVPREEAAVLLADLRARSDCREHNSPNLLISNGQSTVVSSTRAQNHVEGITMQPNSWPNHQQKLGQVDEGFSLAFSPLASVDGKMIDATIKCTVDRVDKMVPVIVGAATSSAPEQKARIEVPQLTQFRLHERFRWPSDQVLLVALNQVALPEFTLGKTAVAGLPLSLPGMSGRADLLVMVEPQAPTANPSSSPAALQATRPTEFRHGRY